MTVVVLLAAIATVGTSVGYFGFPGFGDGPSASLQTSHDAFSPASIDELAAISDVIVRGTVRLTEEHVTVQSPSQVDARSGTRVGYAVYTVTVTETLKGTLQPSDTELRVYFPQWLEGYGPGPAVGDWRVRPPQVSAGNYLVFVGRRDGVLGAQGELAEAHYEAAAMPFLAEVEDSSVRFQDPPDYLTPPSSSSLFGKIHELNVVRAVSRTARLPEIAADPMVDAIRARGTALETLITELPTLRSEDAVRKRVAELGLDAASLGDPAFCRKVQEGISQFGGRSVDLGCDGVP